MPLSQESCNVSPQTHLDDSQGRAKGGLACRLHATKTVSVTSSTFARKKDADAHEDTLGVDVRQGVHTAPHKSITVASGCRRLGRICRARRPRALNRHAVSGSTLSTSSIRLLACKLANLTTPRINAFRDDLLANMSRPLAQKVLTSLKSLLKMRSGAATSLRTWRSTCRSASISAASVSSRWASTSRRRTRSNGFWRRIWHDCARYC